MKLSKDFRFEAAHSLPNMPDGHKCKRLHGHSYRFRIVVRGPKDEATGFCCGLDYAHIKHFVQAHVLDLVDHRFLDEVLPTVTTAENVGIWIWQRLIRYLPQLYEVKIYETCTTAVVIRKEDVP